MMIKAKFGDSLKSKNRVAQENELLSKILAHNITMIIRLMFEPKNGTTIEFSNTDKSIVVGTK